MKKCPNPECKSIDNPDDAKFCEKCGAKLNDKNIPLFITLLVITFITGVFVGGFGIMNFVIKGDMQTLENKLNEVENRFQSIDKEYMRTAKNYKTAIARADSLQKIIDEKDYELVALKNLYEPRVIKKQQEKIVPAPKRKMVKE